MLLVILGVAAPVIGIVIATRQGRQFAARKLLPSLRSSLASLRRVARSPAKLTLLFGGSALVTLAYVGGLAASVEAFGGGAHSASEATPATEPFTLVGPQQVWPWLPQPVLVILVSMLDQRQRRHLLVLEQVRRPDLNGFGLAPCGKDHRFVLEHLLIDVERCAQQ
jgi:hypothetical protein